MKKLRPCPRFDATFSQYDENKDGEIPLGELPVRKASTGQPVRDYEFDVVFENGTCRNLLASAVPLFGEDGRPRGAVGAFVDITERKRAEQQLRDSEARFRAW